MQLFLSNIFSESTYFHCQAVANAKDVVVGAREAVTTTVTGAKETVAHTITGVVDKTKEAMQDSVEMTKSVVNGGINTVLGSRVVQMVSSGMDSALTKSETLVDQYLPLTEAKLGKNNSGLILMVYMYWRETSSHPFITSQQGGSMCFPNCLWPSWL